MLTFVGLGLYDERSITVEGRNVLTEVDRAVAEFYTSRLVGATVSDLEAYHDREIEVRERPGIEGQPDFLDDAENGHVAFLTAGDPLISTTHVDLRLRAAERGIDTRVVHGVTAAAAAAGITGLQNYRFGKATTLPFEGTHGPGVPDSVVATIADNRERGLHTLVFLDIEVGTDARGEEDRFMTADRAAELLADPLDDPLGVAVARAGSPVPVVAADQLSTLAERDFGDPLHLLVVPGDLHHVEGEALETFAGAPKTLL